MTDMTPDGADDDVAFAFIDVDPPQLPAEVWERSLAVALDPSAEYDDDLVPDMQLEDAYADPSALDTDAVVADVDPNSEPSGFHDPLDQPDSTSSWNDTYSGPDAGSHPTGYDGDPW